MSTMSSSSSMDQQSTYGTARRRHQPQQHNQYTTAAQSNSSYIDVGRIGAESMGLGRDFFSGHSKHRVPTIKISSNSEWRRGSRALLFTVALLVCATGLLSVRSVQSLRLQQQSMQASHTTGSKLHQSQNMGITAQSNLAKTSSTPNLQANLQAASPKGEGILESLAEIAVDVIEDVVLQEAQPKTSTTSLMTSPKQASVMKTQAVPMGNSAPLQETIMGGTNMGDAIPMEETLIGEGMPKQDILKAQAVQLEAAVPQGEAMPMQATNARFVRHRPGPRGTNDMKAMQSTGTGPGEPAPHAPPGDEHSVHGKREGPHVPNEDIVAATPAPVPASSTTTSSIISTTTIAGTDGASSTTAGTDSTSSTTTTTVTDSASSTSSTTRNTKERWDSLDGPSQNQMLMISSVAIVALAVGAVSARKLRSKSFLSDCIENESLEDDLAYDTENTFGGVGQYGSFSAPWRGDLEKFDV